MSQQDDINIAEEINLATVEVAETPNESIPIETVEVVDNNLFEEAGEKMEEIATLWQELQSETDEYSPEVSVLAQKALDIDNEIKKIKERETQLTNMDIVHSRISALKKQNEQDPNTMIPMEQIEQAIEYSSIASRRIDALNKNELLLFADDVYSLQNVFNKTIDKGLADIPREEYSKRQEERQLRYPKSFEQNRQLLSVENTAYEQIGFKNLSSQTKERYMHNLGIMSHTMFAAHKGGAYWFGWNIYEEPTPGGKLLEEITENPSRRLSSEEENAVYEYEQDTFKIHLTVPPERKIEVLKAILETQKQDMAIIENLFAQKRQEGGNNISVSNEEVEVAGGKANFLSVYKMGDGEDNPNNVADFIFYPVKTEKNSAKEISAKMINQLKSILEPLNLPQIEKMPRYSTPVVINGETIPAISVAQGNGDFKDYLLQNDPATLNRFYDRSRNYALRPNESFAFSQ